MQFKSTEVSVCNETMSTVGLREVKNVEGSVLVASTELAVVARRQDK